MAQVELDLRPLHRAVIVKLGSALGLRLDLISACDREHDTPRNAEHADRDECSDEYALHDFTSTHPIGVFMIFCGAWSQRFLCAASAAS